MSATDLENLVRQFVVAALANPSVGKAELVSSLGGAGIDWETAECLLGFVPLAFGRAVLARQGVEEFPVDFEIEDRKSGRKARGRLRDEPIFVAAEAYAAKALAEGGGAAEAVAAIAGRSPEMDVFLQLSENGADARDIRFTETLFLRLPIEHLEKRGGGAPSEKPPEEPRPWWQFWKS